ncbi:MAG: glycosyltransferase, partial [Candidatus Saccharimonadales bacterium]
MKKNLIIDGQILQTDAWYRGMGKYTLRVIQGLDKETPDNLQVYVLFNTSIRSHAERFKIIKFLCPGVKQIHLSLPLAKGNDDEAKDYKSKLSSYIKEELKDGANFYLVTSLFFFDFLAEFPENCRKMLLFYDLTPLLFWRDLGGYFPPKLYMSRFQKLYEAERIFCISDTTRKDLLNTFGLDPGSIVNINGGFTKIAETTQKPISFHVPKKYILFPTGDLPHKNNEIAIKGFEQYCQETGEKTPLLITSHFKEESKKHLSYVSDKIIFTDNVLDEELEWLYENAESVLFASKYEGLGMPVLDAVANSKPIVASDIPVFKEMTSAAFYF